jgi:hypothetical protein
MVKGTIRLFEEGSVNDQNRALKTAYLDECASLVAHCFSHETSLFFSGFLERWHNHHARVIATFEQESSPQNTEKWAGLPQQFLTQRARMFSALAQGLSKEHQANFLRDQMKNYLREHDIIFIRILNAQHEMLKKELNDAQNVRTAIGAYARSARQMGDANLW